MSILAPMWSKFDMICSVGSLVIFIKKKFTNHKSFVNIYFFLSFFIFDRAKMIF